jgi:hypothetical protein
MILSPSCLQIDRALTLITSVLGLGAILTFAVL